MSTVKEPIKCLTPDCTSPAKYRGICPSCYGCARSLIDKGETSWEELRDMNLVDLPEKPFYKAFKAKKKEKDDLKGSLGNVKSGVTLDQLKIDYPITKENS